MPHIPVLNFFTFWWSPQPAQVRRAVFSHTCPLLGSSLCPVPVITRHVAMRTRVQDWTRVCILMGPVATGHWTKALPPLLSPFTQNNVLSSYLHTHTEC